jgi:hypothetical protein
MQLRAVLALFLVSTLLTSLTLAEDHSTVSLVFVVPSEPKMNINEGGERAVALVGNVMLPVDSIRPISISIDDKFVGHALVGPYNVKPVFMLPSGSHEFSFTCEGFRPTSARLEVLGNGSQQFLIVKMTPETPSSKSTDQSKGIGSDAAAGSKP